MSARHRKANTTRRALYEAQRATHEARGSLDGWAELTCVTEEQADRLARLAEKSAAIAREVDMISEELLPALRAYEERRVDDA